jgi:hypothetical protein
MQYMVGWAARSGPPPGAVAPSVSLGPRRITLGEVSFRPGSLDGVQTSPTGGRVEYLLARNAVIREYRKGRLSRLDVCDAHPELLRVATNLGRSAGESCPICEESDLVEVTFVFGARLPSGGRCVATQTELTRYWRRKDPVVCYVIEVCTGCRWNHLTRMYPAGAGVDAVARKPLRGRATL